MIFVSIEIVSMSWFHQPFDFDSKLLASKVDPQYSTYVIAGLWIWIRIY